MGAGFGNAENIITILETYDGWLIDRLSARDEKLLGDRTTSAAQVTPTS